MEQRLSLITLGVSNLERSRAFYERLGWTRSMRAAEGVVAAGADGLRVRAVVPCWDGGLRQLHWQGRVVKHFRLPAANQEAILAALEEEGWPERIDDPLPPADEVEPKARLHDAIKGLNRNQVHRLVCFRGDGTGRGVVWCPAAQP